MSDFYFFRLPVGDWSNDGHGHCDWFDIVSNKPVDYVRDTYFDMVAGFPLFVDLFGKCEESTIDVEDYEKLIAFCPRAADILDELEPETYLLPNGTEDFAKLFIICMQQWDIHLELEIKPIQKPPMFPFYGRDDKGRHISQMGYGLFYM